MSAPRGAAKRGKNILIVGPDGSGKSTVAQGLLELLSERGPVMHLHHRPGLLPRKTIATDIVDDPHGSPPYGKAISLLKIIYVFIDFKLSWRRRVAPLIDRGGTMLIERGWWDLEVDPLRYRLSAGRWLVKSLGRFIARPDLVVVLEAPTKVLIERKRELPEEELETQMGRWRKVLPCDSRTIFLDATKPVERLVSQIDEQLLKAQWRSSSGSWINLPNRRNARWILPRSPKALACGSLPVYQPVTLRGLAAWRLANGLSARGGFRLLPKGTPPPEWICSLIAPYLGHEDSFALARGNHEGRAVALLLDRTGRAFALAKIARTESGCAALFKESEGIRQLGKDLTKLARAPEVLDSREGLLLERFCPWTPRVRPWYLPEPVAKELGALFMSHFDSSRERGAGHGDFAPWNLLRGDDRWTLVDWEDWGEDKLPYEDVFHYLIQSHSLLGRPSKRALLDGLDGQGWIGGVLDAYETGAGRSQDARKDWFVEYLVRSREKLNVSSSDGRKADEARLTLVAEMIDG